MRTNNSWIVNVGSPEAVRRIPINTISLTGEVLGKSFESSLERDLIMKMVWSHQLDWFQVQPVKIPFTDANGRSRSYTPDLLVQFAPDPDGVVEKPLLCEVKYREELRRNWAELRPRFKAARAHSRERGWVFRIFTEDRIRTPYLANVQFLWSYRYADWHEPHYERLFEMLDDMEETTVAGLLEACYRPDNRIGRGEGLWTLWVMVAQNIIHCDLHVPLSQHTRIWLDPRLRSSAPAGEDD